MWIYWNPNPNGKQVGDCTIRAITKALGKEWHDVFFALTLQGAVMCDMPSSNAVWSAFLKKNGFRRITLPADCPDCYTVQDFCNDHPEGLFVVGIGTHVLTVIDGNYFDSWDSGNETPAYYFEKKEG